MNTNTNNAPRGRWTFCMIDVRPGPSVGDAAVLIEMLGLDPRSFPGLKIIAEFYNGPLAMSQFEVTGPHERIQALKLAHARVTGSTTMPLRLAPALPEADRQR